MAAGLLDTLPVPVNWHWHGAELGHLLTGSRVVFEDLTGVVREALPPGVPLVEVPVPPELYEAYGLVARGASGIEDCVTS
jgi:long-chain acyl-CoA synthetase